MAEWLYEAGIGEARAALVDGDRILRAAIELDDTRARVGTVASARLIELLPGRGGRVVLDTGEEALLAPLPAGITQGAALTVEIVRTAIPEPGRPKPAKAIPTDASPGSGPDLLARITASGHPVRTLRAHEPDLLEAAGWSELLDEAASGEIAFPGGALRMSPTPAMTLFDIDGGAPLEQLAVRGAQAVAAAILRFDIGGSIGLDLPTLAGKAARTAVTQAFDAGLPQPFERTAMNGFGFLQVIRPRTRASLPELLRADPVAAAARAALRVIERAPPGPARAHRLPPAVRAAIEAHPDWLAELHRRTGVLPVLES